MRVHKRAFMRKQKRYFEQRTVFAVGVLETDWACATVEVKGRHASTTIETRLIDARVVAVVHVLAAKSVFKKFDLAVVNNNLHIMKHIICTLHETNNLYILNYRT